MSCYVMSCYVVLCNVMLFLYVQGYTGEDGLPGVPGKPGKNVSFNTGSCYNLVTAKLIALQSR